MNRSENRPDYPIDLPNSLGEIMTMLVFNVKSPNPRMSVNHIFFERPFYRRARTASNTIISFGFWREIKIIKSPQGGETRTICMILQVLNPDFSIILTCTFCFYVTSYKIRKYFVFKTHATPPKNTFKTPYCTFNILILLLAMPDLGFRRPY